MAERKAVNKYYPPDWDPRKGSVNKRVGQHPLRDRARKLSQGILVIRFELPYNIWCGGCGSHVGMGVRYNAEKSKVGNYYSTPIYKFRMKCHLCDNYFEIQTDPKNHDYVILSGARRKEQRWDPVANEQVVPEDKATQKKLATDPMYKLEHGSDDQQKGKEKVMTLAQIEDSRLSMRDDYILNRMARDMFRGEKKLLKEAAEADRAILERGSLDIDLVEETEEDKKLADLMKYSVTSSFEDKQKEIRKKIEQRPLFGDEMKSTPLRSASASSSGSSSPSSSITSAQMQPAVSLHGANSSKKQLSKTLQASYKDPFKTVRKKEKGSLIYSSLNRNKLGIRLLSSDDMKSMAKTKTASQILKGRSKESKGTDAKRKISNGQQPSATVDSLKCSSHLLDTNNMTDSVKCSPTSKSINVPKSICDTSYDGTTTLYGGVRECEPHATGEQKSTPQTLISSSGTQNSDSCMINNSATTSADGTECDTMKQLVEESAHENAGNSKACDNRNTESTIRRHSGLQTLISSYTESDSDSSS